MDLSLVLFIYHRLVPLAFLAAALLIVAFRQRTSRAAWLAPLVLGATLAAYFIRAMIVAGVPASQAVPAYLTLYCIPASALSIVGATMHRRALAGRMQAVLLCCVFFPVQYVGFRLSTGILDFVNAAG